MGDFDDIKVGDEVYVSNSYGSRECNLTTVTKVGTKLITAGGQVFRKDTGYLNDKNYPYHAMIKTAKMIEDEDRRTTARQVLREEYGLAPVGWSIQLTTDQLEAVVETLRSTGA